MSSADTELYRRARVVHLVITTSPGEDGMVWIATHCGCLWQDFRTYRGYEWEATCKSCFNNRAFKRGNLAAAEAALEEERNEQEEA